MLICSFTDNIQKIQPPFSGIFECFNPVLVEFRGVT